MVLPVALYLVADGFVRATSRRPFQGSGVSATIRGISQAQRECESRFPLQRAEAKRFKRKAKAFYISDIKCFCLYPPPLLLAQEKAIISVLHVTCLARTEYMQTAYNCHNNRAVNLLCCLKNFLHCAVRNEWIEKNRFRYCKLKIDKTNVKVLLMKAELDLLPGWRSSKSFITEKIERAFY